MLCFIGYLLGMFGALTIIKYGKGMGVLDIPNERSSHDIAVPKGGGVGILVAFVFCSLTMELPFFFYCSAFVVSLVSFIGDRFDIKPTIRLLIQSGCGVVFAVGLMAHHAWPILMYLLVLPVVLFITGTANCYNFMDGINGIAAIAGILGFSLLAFYGAVEGFSPDYNYIDFPCIMACACAGFIPFNIPKARVFMGDVGSVLLGFVFACLVVMMSRDFLDFICLAAFLFPFYADEIITMLIRIRDGDRLTKAHRKHIYQILANEYGIDHWKVSAGYGGLQALIGLSVLFLKPSGYAPILVFLTLCLSGFFLLSWYLRNKLKTCIHLNNKHFYRRSRL